MSDEEKINYLAGQVQMLTALAGAVIMTHPDPAVLRLQIERLYQITLSQSETKMVSEEYITGIMQTRDSLGAF